MLSVASTRTEPISSAIITAPGEKCGLAAHPQPSTNKALATEAWQVRPTLPPKLSYCVPSLAKPSLAPAGFHPYGRRLRRFQ